MPPVNVHIVLRSDDCVMAMANNYPETDVWGVRATKHMIKVDWLTLSPVMKVNSSEWLPVR